MAKELYYLSIEEASQLIKRRQLSPVGLTQAYLDRIQSVDGRLHCYITLVADKALDEARRAEGEITRGNYRGPMHGIPIGLKDLCDTAGTPTTGGSRAFKDRVPVKDATVVRKLKEAGSILLGKLNMSELAMTGGPNLGEDVKNPWNVEHIPGGSSSGSAAAVAAGLCAGALGSDTGGSIRGPASYCNIVGLVPTYGRVSRAGVMPLSWSLDHVGPMTRTVEDAAIMLSTIAGYDSDDPTSLGEQVPDFHSRLVPDVKDLTLGVLTPFYSSPDLGFSREVLVSVAKGIETLEDMGARIKEVSIPSLRYAPVAGAIIYLAEGFICLQGALRERPQEIGSIFRRYGYTGALLSAADYVQAQRLRSRLKREAAQVFGEVDLLVLPSTPSPAPSLQEFNPNHLTKFEKATASVPFNLVGSPSISVPCGFNEKGLPIGLQFAGRPRDEATVLCAAYAYQTANPLHKKHPPL